MMDPSDAKEIKIGPDQRLWAVRSTLIRLKAPVKVVDSSSHQAHSIGRRLSRTPENPFDCNDDECNVCFPQFFPAAISVTDREARDMAASLTLSIKQDLQYLRQALQDHADLIVSRWKKKTRAKRSAFLSTNTKLYPKKWAVVHILDHIKDSDPKLPDNPKNSTTPRWRLRETGNVAKDGKMAGIVFDPNVVQNMYPPYEDTWFLPYLDADMLSEDPTLFLSLLHHRTANEPDKWLTFDNAHIVLAEHFSIIEHTFNPHCVVMQGPEYGKLVPWSAKQAHHWEAVGFTKARFILTAQQKMMKLLRNCVSSLLAESDQPPKLSVHPKWTLLTDKNFSRFETNFAWSTDSVKPFSNPPSFDAVEIMELIASRHRAVRDELELLQTDPEYVQQQVREMSSSSFFETFPKLEIMPFMVDYLFLGTMRREIYWRQLAYESERLGRRLEALSRLRCPTTQRNFDRAVWIVQDLCIETFAIFEEEISGGLLLQTGFQNNFDYEGSGRFNKHNRTFSRRDCFPEDILFWSVSCLGFDEYRPFTMDPSLNFAAMDYLCRTQPKEAGRLSQAMLDRLSDMSVLSEIMNSIRSDVTRDRCMTKNVARDYGAEGFRSEFVKKINAKLGTDAGDRLGPYLGRLYYQNQWPGGRKDEAWLKKATAARESLDSFWQACRVIWVEKQKEAKVSQEQIDDDLALLRVSKSIKHLDELNLERRFILREERKRLALKNADSGLSMEIQTVWGNENDAPADTTMASKLKVKTQKDPSPEKKVLPPVVDIQTLTLAEVVISPIPVKRDNLSVFNHMFPSRGDESQRSFSWQHFLNAMTDAGFHILQSQGSAVTLKLGNETRDDKVTTIVVHRPHPVATLNPVMLRSIAKRMQKWFGWKRELFVEREK